MTLYVETAKDKTFYVGCGKIPVKFWMIKVPPRGAVSKVNLDSHFEFISKSVTINR